MKLMFPKDDPRSDGKPIDPKRPWMYHGAVCQFVKKNAYCDI